MGIVCLVLFLLDMRSIQLLVVLFFFVVESYQRCSHPKGATGELFTDGCLQRICKEGEWRTTLAENLCCFERRAYTINTTISSIMSKDVCVRAAIDCVEDMPGHAKMIHTMKNFCQEEQNIAGTTSEQSLPEFTDVVENKTIVAGREAVLSCHVNHLGSYKVAWVKVDTRT